MFRCHYKQNRKVALLCDIIGITSFYNKSNLTIQAFIQVMNEIALLNGYMEYNWT